MVLTAALGIGVGGIHYYLFGTMIHPFQEAYGWSRAEISLGLAIISYLSPVTSLAAGAAVDRFGARPTALTGAVLFGLGFMLLGSAGPALWTWYATCTLFALLSFGVSTVVWTSMVVKRFERQRGLALAMSLMGGAVMVTVTPMLVVFLVGQVGVRGVFFTVALFGAVLMLVPTYLFVREPASAVPVDPIRSGGQQAGTTGHSLREAFGSRQYWQLAAGLALVSCCMGTFMAHIQPMLIDTGLSPAVAASVALFIGPSMIVGRLTTGILFDHFDPRAVTGCAFLLPVVAAALVMNLDGGYVISATAGVFIGLGMGAEIDVVAYLTSRYFGLRRYGMLFGILLSIYSIGVGTGSVVAGASFDFLGSYNPALVVLGVGSLVAALLAATLGRPDK